MKKILARVVFISAILLIPISLALYIFNPSGTATLDPRARVLGFVPYHIPGSSMDPTLVKGDFIVALTYVYASREPRRAEVVTFKYPRAPNVDYVKRIIGLPGEEVTITGRQIFINGEELQEDYIQHIAAPTKRNKTQSWQVPEQQYFVMGDNRDNSADSRAWGFLPRDHIIGRVEYVWFSEQNNSGPINYDN